MNARFPEERLAVFTLTERPDLRAQLFSAEIQSGLPEFMRHDRTAALYYSDGNLDRYLDFAFAGVDRERPDRVIARAFSVPFAFRDGSPERDELPDDGWERVIRWAHQDWRKGRMPLRSHRMSSVRRSKSSSRGWSGNCAARWPAATCPRCRSTPRAAPAAKVSCR